MKTKSKAVFWCIRIGAFAAFYAVAVGAKLLVRGGLAAGSPFVSALAQALAFGVCFLGWLLADSVIKKHMAE